MADTILATSACYYGKQMGVISVGQENLFWRPDGHLVYTFTLPYSDLQSIHVNTGEKCLLKITPTEAFLRRANHPSYASGILFQFLGNDCQTGREKIKATLAEQLAKFRAKMSTTDTTTTNASTTNASTDNAMTSQSQTSSSTLQQLKLKSFLLAHRPDLLELHRSLVTQGRLMTDEEFWEGHEALLALEQAKETQVKGVASNIITAMLKPTMTTQAAAGSSLFTGTAASHVKYTLTPAIIRAIFVQCPSVLQAYRENVPDKIGEKEFWTQYFQSRLFHERDNFAKPVASGEGSEANLLDAYILREEQQLQAPELVMETTTTPWGGDRPAATFELLYDGSDEDVNTSGDFVLKNDPKSFAMIRKLNRHSELVLRSSCGSGTAARSSSLRFGYDDLDLGLGGPGKTHASLDLNLDDYQQRRLTKLSVQESSSSSSSSLSPGSAMATTNVSAFVEALNFRQSFQPLPGELAHNFMRACIGSGESAQDKLRQYQAYVDAREDILVFQRKAIEVLRHFWSSHRLLCSLKKQKRSSASRTLADDPNNQSPHQDHELRFHRMCDLVKKLVEQLDKEWLKKVSFAVILEPLKVSLDAALKVSQTLSQVT